MSGSSLLEVRDLHVWFTLPGGAELHAVQGVGFELAAGERFGLVGESGCGKTTSILAMMGLLPPNASVAGEVRLAGLTSSRAARTRSGRTGGPTSRWCSRTR